MLLKAVMMLLSILIDLGCEVDKLTFLFCNMYVCQGGQD